MDPMDRAWLIFRLTMEEAENRYGLKPLGSISKNNGIVKFIIWANGYEMDFHFSLDDLSDTNFPTEVMTELIVWPLLRQLAEVRGKKGDNDEC